MAIALSRMTGGLAASDFIGYLSVMLTAQDLIERFGGPTATARRINDMVEKTSRCGDQKVSRREIASARLVHNWKEQGAIPRQWLAHFAVMCLDQQIKLRVEDVIALAGGGQTLAQLAEAMGVNFQGQEPTSACLVGNRRRTRRLPRGRGA
jgi:hypothetical protein